LLAIKRIYDPPSKADGRRVLVDRLWPRGMKKEEARVDEWMKDISPSNVLRKWFSHDPSRWKDFRVKFRKELKGKQDLVERLRDYSAKGRVTLLYSAKDEEHNNAVVIKEVVEGK
jgi:uncharacterized protein YeaO (DUF488 family)